jgi:hypothetical protein
MFEGFATLGDYKRNMSIKDNMILEFAMFAVKNGASQKRMLTFCKSLRKHTRVEVKKIIKDMIEEKGWK